MLPEPLLRLVFGCADALDVTEAWLEGLIIPSSGSSWSLASEFDLKKGSLYIKLWPDEDGLLWAAVGAARLLSESRSASSSMLEA